MMGIQISLDASYILDENNIVLLVIVTATFCEKNL